MRAHEIAGGDEQAFQSGEVAGRQAPERRADERVLNCDRAFGGLAPRRREVNLILAPVDGGGAALDEPRAFQPVEQAGNVALGDIEPLGEILLADALGFGQRRQHVALRDRKPDFAQSLGHRRVQPALQPNEAEPDAHREILGFRIDHAQSSPRRFKAASAHPTGAARARAIWLRIRGACAHCQARPPAHSVGLKSATRLRRGCAAGGTGGNECWD